MKISEVQFRLEKATLLINQIRFAENVLDELFFCRPTISVAPPPVDFFKSYTQDAYQKVILAQSEYRLHTESSPDNNGLPAGESAEPVTYPENYGEIIGQRIRTRRSEIGVTQNELAEKTGIKRPNIARLEKGQSLPNLATLLKVSSALHISLEKLLSL
ncbi:MAG: helix-turn-helix transcriptional regulator [Deltaproteobacteria bacterium]|nr:helix-turn-helix transcriptional regulator [Deltaproteobacteria bacterium]